jgi:arylformamidase
MTNIVDKIREAIVWIWNNADEYSISKNRINVSGHSAGGHITGMVLAT